MIPLSFGLAVWDFARSIVSGDRTSPLEVARGIADLAVQVLPVEQLKPLLDEAARRRAETAANLAEDLKFGPAQ